MPRSKHLPPIDLQGPKAHKQDLDSSVYSQSTARPVPSGLIVARDVLTERCKAYSLSFVSSSASRKLLTPEAYRLGMNAMLEILTSLGVVYVE